MSAATCGTSQPRISLRSSGLRFLLRSLHRAVTHRLDLDDFERFHDRVVEALGCEVGYLDGDVVQHRSVPRSCLKLSQPSLRGAKRRSNPSIRLWAAWIASLRSQ